MIGIVITADYEVFGDGSGEVDPCVVRPTRELARVCELHGAKVTLFFEVVEHWAFEEAERSGRLPEPGPAGLMRAQARELVATGHDVQLHLHPQWLEAEPGEEGWRLNLDWWRLPELPHGLGEEGDRLSLRGLLKEGKDHLERMLESQAQDYECLALRAGGWCIQPAGEVLRAMAEVGLKADSSVFKGGYLKDGPYRVDFRQAFSEARPWVADPEDICRPAGEGGPGIRELPIYTRPLARLPRWLRYRLLRGQRPGPLGRNPAGCTGRPLVDRRPAARPSSPGLLWGYLFRPLPVQWDFCDLNAEEMWSFLARAVKRHHREGAYLPLIMTGHPKSFTNGPELARFLARVTKSRLFREGRVEFATLRAAVRKVLAEG